MNEYKDRSFQGKVVDNKDPDYTCKVKVTIPGILEGDIANLPWCVPETGSSGVNSSNGFIVIPAIGTNVSVVFQDGDPQFPKYTGSSIVSNQLPSAFKTNYPDRYGFIDETGNLFYVDKKAGTTYYTNGAGTTLTIKGATVRVQTGKTTLDSDVEITKTLTVVGNTTMSANLGVAGTMNNAGVDVGNTHTHIQNDGNDNGGGVATNTPT